MTEPLIEVIGVTRRFESRAETVVALDDVSFSIGSGGSVGVGERTQRSTPRMR